MANLIDIMGKNFGLKNNVKRINGVNVEIKGYLDVETFANIVSTVAKTCFIDNEYRAENREIARRFVILKYMTDVEVDEENINEIFKTTQGGTWYGDIEREVIKLPIWGEVEQAIDKEIDYLAMSRETGFDKLCADLSRALGSFTSDNLNDVKDMLDKLSTVNKEEFVEVATKKAARKTKAGEKNGSKKSKGTTEPDSIKES